MNLLRAIVGFWMLLSFALDQIFRIGQVGYIAQSKGGKTYVSAGSHPVLLVWSAIAVVLFLVLMRTKASETPDGVPTLPRRYLAFILDFLFIVSFVSTIGALLPLWIESTRTGHFSWHFVRDYYVPADDIFGFPFIFLSMTIMLLYFVWPLTRDKQTLGCFFLRLKVTPPFGDRGAFTFRDAVRRTWYEFKGVCSVWRMKEGRDSSGRTWYDRETNCGVVLIRYD